MTALEARKLAEDEMKAGKTPKYKDLRDWLEIVDSIGELKKVDGVDWNLEMGTLAEIFARQSKSGVTPAVLFDNVPGYPKGYRTLFAQNASFKRMALNLGLDMPITIGPTTPAAIGPPCKSPSTFPIARVPNIILPTVPRIGTRQPKLTPNISANGKVSRTDLAPKTWRYKSPKPIIAATMARTRR